MTVLRGRRVIPLVLLLSLVVMLVSLGAGPAAAQDALAHAKDLYEAASYEEALQVLDKLRTSAPSSEQTEASAYQVFCLVALGRTDEAKRAVEAIVKVDPMYHPSETEVSPRVRAFFEDVRRPMLPDVTRQVYAKAREAYDRKDMRAADQGFTRVLKLLDEPALAGMSGAADLKTVASGFRDLSRMAAVPAAPAVVPYSPGAIRATTWVALGTAPPRPSAPLSLTSVPESARETVRTFSAADSDVTPPVPISRTLPLWHPVSRLLQQQDFVGSLDLVIDQNGNIASAKLAKSVNAVYDPLLLDAAKSWKFRPATRGGVPVRYRYTMQISLQHTTGSTR